MRPWPPGSRLPAGAPIWYFPVAAGSREPSAELTAHEGNDLRADELDARHQLVVRQCPTAVFEAKARKTEHAHGLNDLFGDGLRRSDVQGAAGTRLPIEMLAANRRPASLPSDSIHHR